LPNPKRTNQELEKLYSCKYFRIFKKNKSCGLDVSVSKRYFKLAVDRNFIKRRIKEIIRQNSFDFFHTDGFVFSVFRPFAELSYQQADKEVCMAVDTIFGGLNKTNGN